jgi:hypothetical protein
LGSCNGKEDSGAYFVRNTGSMKLDDLVQKLKKNVFGDLKGGNEYKLTQGRIFQGPPYPLMEMKRLPKFVVVAQEKAAVEFTDAPRSVDFLQNVNNQVSALPTSKLRSL